MLINKRKLRNRLSQRAFRRRQAESLRELKNRANASQAPDNERVLTLEQENSRLRVQLAQFHSQLEGVQATLSLMSKTLSNILDEKTPPAISRQSSAEGEDPGSSAAILDTNQSGAVSQASTVDETLPSSDLIAGQVSSSDITVNTTFLQPMTVPDHTAAHSLIGNPQADPPLSASPLHLQQVPRIWSFEYQMGHQSYTDALGACPGGFAHGLGWAQSNSPFSDHIQILKRLLLTKVDMTRPVDAQSYQK